MDKDGTNFRVGTALVTIVGGASLIGVPMIPLAIFLLFIGFIFVNLEIFERSKAKNWSLKKQKIAYTTSSLIFIYLTWTFVFVFKVDMNIRYINGGLRNDGSKSFYVLKFAVELVNKGRSTSLTDWKSVLIMPNGNTYPGEGVPLNADNIGMESHDKIITYYKLPESDLILETAKAMQTGDAVYGILAFKYYLTDDLSSPDIKFQLQATDMLGRTIESNKISMVDVDNHSRNVFPCQIVQPTTQPTIQPIFQPVLTPTIQIMEIK
jgi:hypothetical protein